MASVRMSDSGSHRRKAVVSACLLGRCCRYDGGHRLDERVINFLKGDEIFPLCPEELAGLPIPRPPSEFKGGTGEEVLEGTARVVNLEGVDLTHEFIQGARAFLERAREAGADLVVLKERSPSCGVRQVYMDGRLTDGKGVLAALLIRHGYKVISNEEL